MIVPFKISVRNHTWTGCWARNRSLCVLNSIKKPIHNIFFRICFICCKVKYSKRLNCNYIKFSAIEFDKGALERNHLKKNLISVRIVVFWLQFSTVIKVKTISVITDIHSTKANTKVHVMLIMMNPILILCKMYENLNLRIKRLIVILEITCHDFL